MYRKNGFSYELHNKLYYIRDGKEMNGMDSYLGVECNLESSAPYILFRLAGLFGFSSMSTSIISYMLWLYACALYVFERHYHFMHAFALTIRLNSGALYHHKEYCESTGRTGR